MHYQFMFAIYWQIIDDSRDLGLQVCGAWVFCNTLNLNTATALLRYGYIIYPNKTHLGDWPMCIYAGRLFFACIRVSCCNGVPCV